MVQQRGQRQGLGRRRKGPFVSGGSLPSGIAAIAFDWGGIFTEGTFDSSAHARLAELHGLPADHVLPLYLDLMAGFEVGEFDLPEFHSRFQDTVGRTSELAEFRSTFLGAVRERAAMYELLASLPGHVKLGMLSNNVPELCDIVRDDPRMAALSAFVFSNEIGVRKPERAAFDALSSALDLPPSAIVFVDDNADNIAAARNLGFVALLLDDLPNFAARWREALPDLPLPEGFAQG